MPRPSLPKTPQPALARGRVLNVGEAMAVAESAYAAEDGAREVRVDYGLRVDCGFPDLGAER